MSDSKKTKEDIININNNTVLELQLGDVIKISDAKNDNLNDKIFYIDYIDKSKMFLINTETLNNIRLSISLDGIISDGTISRIAILSRSESASYAKQNNLLPGEWINIYFSGDFPTIITGEITNLENDMIEIKTIDGDIIYLNFDYKGIPEDLPIKLIEIREKPSKPLSQEIDQEIELLEPDIAELNKEIKFVEPSEIEVNIPLKNIKDQIRQFIVKADQVRFSEEEYGPIVQYIDVDANSKRYSIETQVSDLLDELLSTIPNIQRTPKVLNNIHTMIERFKQLRENFSNIDQYGNIESPLFKSANYKPILSYFKEFNLNLYWILPVVKNKKKTYNDIDIIDEENTDVVNIYLNQNLENISEIIENYKSNSLPVEQNKYTALYSELNSYLTPFELVGEENKNGIIYEKEVFSNINTIVNNLEEMYSSVFYNNSIRTRRFVIQKYNTALSKLDTIDATSSKLITIRTNITNNDIMSIKSFLTLPEPIIRFSKINLPSTSILDKANLNLHFLNYWQLLKKKTNIHTILIDSFEQELDYNDEGHDFANNIKNFVLNLSEDELNGKTRIELYEKFVKQIVPKIKVLFNLMKKYITGKLSIVDVVGYLEPFLIYTDDLTFMQYKEIIQFINEQISKYNKDFIEKSRIFRGLNSLSKNSFVSSSVFSVINLLDKKYKEQVLEESYNINNSNLTFTNSEILKKIITKDNLKLYTTSISLQNISLMFPSEISSIFEDERNKLENNLKQKEDNDKCKTITISKYYTSLEQLNEDNNKIIYFDKKYDKTNYGLLEDNYAKEVMTMSSEELYNYITNDLIQKKKMSELDAEYLSETLVDGYKKVKDGQFAILFKGYHENTSDEVDFYIRKNNKWEIDKNLGKENINTDESVLLCDIQKQCISIPNKIDDKCTSIEVNDISLQSKLLKDVISEFDTKYKITKEELNEKIKKHFEYLISQIAIMSKIETTNLLKYNNQKYKLGILNNLQDDQKLKIVSPYTQLLNLILRQSDFVKKQKDIIIFYNKFTRGALPGLNALNEIESSNWLYCIKTSVPLLPKFKLTLAQAFVVEGQYKYIDELELIKSSIGKLSDDGDWWCDEHSGWPICPGNFDIDEGYDEGFKVSTRAIFEEDAGNKIISASVENKIKYSTPDSKMINNIINALSIAMGINIENQKEFIINCVLKSITEKVESEIVYKDEIKKMAEKGKKIPSYKDFYNSSLLYFTFGSFLIACQTAIPSIKTRKTHPGCIRSFTGYPFQGTGDLESLTYLGCVAYDIRESGEPWNVLKGKKKEVIIQKIKSYIDVLLENPDVNRKFEEKTNYFLISPSSEIPEEHDISKWFQFLPPLLIFKIKHLSNISNEFKKSLLNDLRSGSINQREKILVINSKIIQFSLTIIEKIQEIVKKNRILLHNSNNEPYLENACCETKDNETTIGYFYSKDSNIIQYNEIVTQLSNMIDDITSYTKGGLFYSDKNTKNKYPSISNDFNEKTIYLSFIYFCKFNSLIPISEDLLPLCVDKPSNDIINTNDLIEKKIQNLKEEGRNYNNDKFIRLLQIISKNNIININFKNPEISSITRLLKNIESIDDENDDVLEKSLRELMINLVDSFDIANINNNQGKNLNNFLIKNIELMKEEIIEFISKNTSLNVTNNAVKKCLKTVKNLFNWSGDNSKRNENIKISDDNLYNVINFYKNFIHNFVIIYPNIILNKVNYDDIHIPNYCGFSVNHSNKLKKNISKHYEKLKSFYGLPSLQNILTTIQKTSKNIVKIADVTPSFTSIKINNDNILKPIFDERTSKFLFEYYLLRICINYIELSDDEDMIVREIINNEEISNIYTVEYIEEVETRMDLSITSKRERDIRLLTGNKKELRQKTTELLIAFLDILNNSKNTIDVSYEDIQDRVFKLREREKDMVTDRLKMMTDEQRDADTILKINKLGMYSKGMQKGLTVLDKNFYDEEQEFRDKMEIAEKNIRKKNSFANDENIDILLDEYFEQEVVENEINEEVYDMDYMNEDYLNGNTDGVDAPEEEYNDYD